MLELSGQFPASAVGVGDGFLAAFFGFARQLVFEYSIGFRRDLNQRVVALREARVEKWLMARKNRVEMGVLRDGFERDVRHAFENKTAFDTAVLETIMIEFRRHQALARNRKRHARSVGRNPATAPRFGHISRRPAAARRVEY